MMEVRTPEDMLRNQILYKAGRVLASCETHEHRLIWVKYAGLVERATGVRDFEHEVHEGVDFEGSRAFALGFAHRITEGEPCPTN